jgi:hypothetical protein
LEVILKSSFYFKSILKAVKNINILRLAVLPTEGLITQNRYMAYITADKVGIQKFPLTGNPFDSIALFAHPDGV